MKAGHSPENQTDPLLEPVGVIGSGIAGLITAHVLLQDGFRTVEVLTRDRSVGGVWSEERVYSGLKINRSVFLPVCLICWLQYRMDVACMESSGFQPCRCAPLIAPP